MTTKPIIVAVHRNSDSYLPWELDDQGRERFPKQVHQGIHYLGYEVELLYMLDMETGHTRLVAALEGREWLTLPGFEVTDEMEKEGRENGRY